MLTVVLSALVGGAAAVSIYAALRSSQRLEMVFKPLTMALIILIALSGGETTSTRYQALVLLGLAASLVGDVILMLPRDRFLYGLTSFLIAHLFYIAAFSSEAGRAAPFWYIIPFVLYGGALLWWLWPYLGSARRPALVYTGVILIMAWQAANRWIASGQDGALLALIGAYLFVMSDSLLTVERFRVAWRSAPLWVLSTYYAAQWLIALSV
jgi:uncharacterized membrane protein YhhN